MISNEHLPLQTKINRLVSLYEKENLKEALLEAKSLANQHPSVSIIYNIYGVINLALGNWNESIVCFSKSIKLKPDNADAFYNMGIAMDNLNNFEEAIDNYAKAIEIKPDFEKANEALIRILSFYDPKKNNSNLCIKTNKLLQKINYIYVDNKKISDDHVINFFKKCDGVISKNIDYLNMNETEIFRSNTVDLKCERHFKVFNTFNVIPEYCFGCYKVQIVLKNVIELFKLYFVFDKLNLKNNNPRKCMVELRSNISGSYKGYIYCFSFNEAKEIQKQMSILLSEKINKNISIDVKRGCSEFAINHPEYNKINIDEDKFMKYDKKWQDKEKIIDNQLSKRDQSKQRVLRKNLPGASVCDILIMYNWISYAKTIGDLSYKKIAKKIKPAPLIKEKINKFMLNRKM
tara:strand:- start:78 stop:1289 length:1212 start_codon:yes stop_codon:yes gene_type:complete